MSKKRAVSYADLRKFNPYHDSRGRFSSANSAASFTYSPGKGKAHDKAIAREKERQAKLDANAKSKAEMKERPSAGNTSSQKAHKDAVYKDSEAPGKIAKDLGITEKEAKKMYDSVQNYSGVDYGEIRKFQQKGPPPDKSQESKALDTFIEKSPKWDGEAYRGINIADSKAANDLINACKAGKTITQNGTSSWSSNRQIAEGASASMDGGTRIVFVSKGKQNGTSIRHISAEPGEDEVIMHSKAQWKATKVTKKSNWYEIECEPIL